mmetsp:Transcript_41478/g.75149  ORF Transcript_41478/g.75149 Transcript_41478/m.75149 type:complete len:240 (+) Transcript_41478:232-951(+)
MHSVSRPLAFVTPVVTPAICPVSMYAILMELPSVVRIIIPGKLALAMLLPLHVLALKPGTIRPSLDPASVLSVAQPMALVFGAIVARKDSKAMCSIIFPLPVVFVTIAMLELTIAISLPIDPLTRVLCSVSPCLNTITMSQLILPLPFVEAIIVNAGLKLGTCSLCGLCFILLATQRQRVILDDHLERLLGYRTTAVYATHLCCCCGGRSLNLAGLGLSKENNAMSMTWPPKSKNYWTL